MKKTITNYFSLLVSVLMIAFIATSCSETDDAVEEFEDWQKKNEAYFKNLYSEVQTKIAAGDASWKIIRSYSMPDADEDFSYTQKPEDCIIVHVETAGTGNSGSPLYTDNVRVHYSGKLIPSASYDNGLVFDKSYSGAFNPQTASPSQFTVNGVVDGFSTALQNMQVGDRWTVYIPYQLGYGKKAQNTIPAYSTLIFDITLHSFFRAGADVPNYQ